MNDYHRKLSADDANDMRELYQSGDFTIKTLSEMYGCAASTAFRIINGYSYQKITGGEPVQPEKRFWKKEGKKGSEHPMHVLTEKDVLAIRKKVANGFVPGQKMKLYKALSNRFRVSEVTIASIATQQSWKHLPSVKELKERKK